MCGILALLFIAVPALEIYVLITVGGMIGAWPTVGIIFATGIAGAALAKHQGFAAVQQLQRSMSTAQEVGQSLAEAALVLVAAVLMVTPGFITDFVGISLLIPPLRKVVARRLVKWGASRMQRGVIIGGPMPPGFDPRGPAGDRDAWTGDADADTDDHEPPPPGVIDV